MKEIDTFYSIIMYRYLMQVTHMGPYLCKYYVYIQFTFEFSVHLIMYRRASDSVECSLY